MQAWQQPAVAQNASENWIARRRVRHCRVRAPNGWLAYENAFLVCHVTDIRGGGSDV